VLPQDASITHSIAVVRGALHKDYRGMFREEGGAFAHPFITPGSQRYADVLWDWGSWLSDVALRQILLEVGTDEDRRRALVLNMTARYEGRPLVTEF
jgi:putative isomerase